MFNVQDIVSAPQTEMMLLYIIAIIAIPFAVGVIFDKNVIRSGFLLIGVFGGISAIFLLLKAPFLALAQLMIYAVGITLVVVIALMLTSTKLNSEIASEEQDIENEPAIMQLIDKTKKAFPFVVAWLSFLTIYLSLRTEGWMPLNKAASAAATVKMKIAKS
jgi:NADH:ubiquinone oxidoreductase subunit 6 (subunit J)